MFENIVLTIPFAITLIILAIFSQHRIWHRYYKYITCIMLFITCIIYNIHDIFHTLLNEYLPFIIMVSSLFIISSHIVIRLHHQANALDNVKIFILGMLLSGIVGTMGSSMITIQALLNANQNRYIKHTLVFFIILVSNVSGTLSSIADPPLLLGYLSGVPFIWPTLYLSSSCMIITFILICMYLAIDYYITREQIIFTSNRFVYYGLYNLFAILCIIFLTVISSNIHVNTLIIRDIPIVLITGSVYIFGCIDYRKENCFTFEPLIELSFVFLAIFSTSVPVIHIITNIPCTLSAFQCFWISGLISSILDNAPTYLMFYKLIGGYTCDTHIYMLLKSISLGSVLMGGMTYIGNAPNLMVRTIAVHRGFQIPSFVEYIMLTVPILGSTLLLYSVYAFI